MTAEHDPELQRFKRSVDLAEYAKKARYVPRPEPLAEGLCVLDHPCGDRIVVARARGDTWIYASVRQYAPRSPSESAEQALARLRACIDRSPDKGSIVEFVQRRDPVAREQGGGLEHVRERLREYAATGRGLEIDPAQLGWTEGRSSTTATHASADLSKRRYDWTPSPDSAHSAEVEQRIRRWQEAQATIDRTRHDHSAPQPAPAAAPSRQPDNERSTLGRSPQGPAQSLGANSASELGRRRYDWTPLPPGADTIVRGPRGRGPERGR
jgi:hypothetical protein